MEHRTDRILSVLDRLIPNHGRVTEIEYLPGGYTNQNYCVSVDGEQFVLRLCRRRPSRPDTEILYLNTPIAPHLVAYEHSTGHMVTELVKGTLLVLNPFSIEESAHYLREIHKTIPSGIYQHDPIEISLNHFANSNIKNELLQFVETTQWRPRKETGCHNDLNPYNIIRTEGGSVVTLDWESAGNNDGLFDLVNLCHGLNYPDDDFFECASLYSNSCYEREYVLQTRLLFQAREHAWALAQMAMGNNRHEVQAQARDAKAEFQRIKQKYSL